MQLDAPFPLTPALSPRRGSTVDRFGLEEPFGVYDRGWVEEAKRGRRCALPPHSIVELNRCGLDQLGLFDFCRRRHVWRTISSFRVFEDFSFVIAGDDSV